MRAVVQIVGLLLLTNVLVNSEVLPEDDAVVEEQRHVRPSSMDPL